MAINHEPNAEQVQVSFAVYAAHMDKLNQVNPQFQGLTEEEFGPALANPSVISTTVEVEGREVQLPQLAPISAFEWLNDDFYHKKFPNQFETGKLLHFTEIPEVEPGEEVLDNLENLAEAGGKLVFDASASDEKYFERLAQVLKSRDIQMGEPEQLGTQTYYAGQTHLKREHPKRDKPVDMLTAYQQQVENGVYPSGELPEGASLVRKIDEDEAERLRGIYDDAYVVLNDHPCKQGLDADEFKDMLVADEEVGKLIYTQDGQITTLCLFTSDLGKLSWVNKGVYEKKFPQRYHNQQLIWFPGIATDPEKQGERNSGKLIDLMCELTEYGDNEIVGLFDFCDLNAGFLDQVFNGMINASPEQSIDIQPFAQQVYWAVDLNK